MTIHIYFVNLFGERGAEISFFPSHFKNYYLAPVAFRTGSLAPRKHLSNLKILARYYHSIFDWTLPVTRNDFLVSSEPYVGIFI